MTLRPPASAEDELRYASVPVSAMIVIKRNNKKSVFFIFSGSFREDLERKYESFICRARRTDSLSA